jgi:ABC-type dipeptide/oligopeptide/nickel transport system permease subunit
MKLLYRKWKRSFFGKLGGLIVFVFVLCAILGPSISPHDPDAMSLTKTSCTASLGERRGKLEAPPRDRHDGGGMC